MAFEIYDLSKDLSVRRCRLFKSSFIRCKANLCQSTIITDLIENNQCYHVHSFNANTQINIQSTSIRVKKTKLSPEINRKGHMIVLMCIKRCRFCILRYVCCKVVQDYKVNTWYMSFEWQVFIASFCIVHALIVMLTSELHPWSVIASTDRQT